MLMKERKQKSLIKHFADWLTWLTAASSTRGHSLPRKLLRRTAVRPCVRAQTGPVTVLSDGDRRPKSRRVEVEKGKKVKVSNRLSP